MAGGIPIRFRVTTSDVPIDPIQLGGALWHELDEKLGIMGVDNVMCWYPGVKPTIKMFVLNEGQRLAGRDSNNDINPFVIDFSSPGNMRFVDTRDDSVVATFNELGASFTNPIVDEVTPGGSLQRTSHPGFLPSLFSSTAISTDTPGFIGPNTYLWKKAGGQGNASARYAYRAGSGLGTHPSAERFTLEFAVTAALQNAGLRSWLFDPSLAYDGASNRNKIFVSYIGPSGQANTFRVGRHGVYAETVVLGNGNWQRIALDLPVHDITTSFAYNDAFEPWAIDWFYNTTGGVWSIAEPTVQNVDIVTGELYQFRTNVERTALADSYYWTPPTQYLMGNQVKSMEMPVSLPAYNGGNASYDIVDLGSDHPLVVTEKGRRAFTIGTSDAVTAQWKAKFKVGYRGPLNDIA